MAEVQGRSTSNDRWGRFGIAAFFSMLILIAGFAIYVHMLPLEQREEVFYRVQELLPVIMFMSLAGLLFSGYPVAFILGGVALTYGLIGYFLDAFKLIEFFNFVPRIWGQAAENLVLVAVPAFVFMGVMMERSGIANNLLYCVQVLLKRVPGALALAVTIMGDDPGRNDRDHRRLGDDDDDGAGAADDDAPGLFARVGDRHHCRLRDPRHPDPAQHHADHHGGPAGHFRRRRVHGGDRAGAGAGTALSRVRLDAVCIQAVTGAAIAARVPDCAERRDAGASTA